MIRSALLGVAALAVVASAAPAASPDPKAMRKALADYGKCIVKREPNKTRDFILSGSFISRRDQDENILLSQECMPGEEMVRAGLAARGGTASRARLRLPDIMIRWAIGQALFDRDQAKLNATDFSGVPALAYEQPFPVRTTTRDGKPIPAERVAEQQRRYDEKASDVALSRVGECVVRLDATKARAVLLTPLDTPEELASLQAVTPALSKCLPQGQTLGFDRMSLRGSLAVAYYRLASAVQPSGAAS